MTRVLAMFRRARPATRAWNVLKTTGQIVVFWSVFLLAIPDVLVRLEQMLGLPRCACSSAAGWPLFVLASVLGLSSGLVMAWHGLGTPLPVDAPRHLVVHGPYRFVRNPMAIAGLAQGAAVACIRQSWLGLAYVAIGLLLWNYVVRPLEEHDLEMQFGSEYRHYRRQVRCWYPRLRPYRAEGGGLVRNGRRHAAMDVRPADEREARR